MNTNKIRKPLLDQVDKLIKGEIDTKQAKQVSNLMSQAVYTIRLELEDKRLETDIAKNLADKPRWDMINGKSSTLSSIKAKD